MCLSPHTPAPVFIEVAFSYNSATPLPPAESPCCSLSCRLASSRRPIEVWCESAQGWPRGGPPKVVRYPLKIALPCTVGALLATPTSIMPGAAGAGAASGAGGAHAANRAKVALPPGRPEAATRWGAGGGYREGERAHGRHACTHRVLTPKLHAHPMLTPC
jgi:hypothetical protein